MLNLSMGVRAFVCTRPTDMRRSFDGLMGMVSEHFGADVLSGHLFLFVNRRRDRLKILYWDNDGFAIWYKRLERGGFQIPDGAGSEVELDAAQLAMLLQGIDWRRAERRKRYRRPVVDAPSAR
jgi:transposase